MNYKHGHYIKRKGTATYRSWSSMKARCDNPNHIYSHNYSEIDIGYTESWKSFENFLADMGERPVGSSLDRIDTSKGYSPENCRWATKAEQAQNSSNATVTWEIVRAIRELYKTTNLTQKAIGIKFDLRTHHISMIVTNKCWKEI